MIKISRIYQDDCTVGVLTYNGFRCFTLELPDKENQPNVSCIPAGTYQAFKRNSPKNGNVIELKHVLNRTNIQVHSGNYTSQILGCILVGDSLKDINRDGIIDVTNSKVTLGKLLELLPDEVKVRIY